MTRRDGEPGRSGSGPDAGRDAGDAADPPPADAGGDEDAGAGAAEGADPAGARGSDRGSGRGSRAPQAHAAAAVASRPTIQAVIQEAWHARSSRPPAAPRTARRREPARDRSGPHVRTPRQNPKSWTTVTPPPARWMPQPSVP